MATPGQPSVCFSCGQPLPASAVGTPPQFPLTGQLAQVPAGPPPNPYTQARGVRLVGAQGEFSIAPGAEVRAGRDPARCAIAFTEPRVSGLHATLKLEGGQLWVRDEMSNNGTYVSGARIPAGTWTPVPLGAPLRFGPIELLVRGD
jgi:pSer/pThr/pTyr-binding forkhead associated (FHA) protein